MKIKNKKFILFYLLLIVNLTIKNLHAEVSLYTLNAFKINYNSQHYSKKNINEVAVIFFYINSK